MDNGFTLVELMITVAIVAVVATVGVPSFLDLLKQNRITTSTNEFVLALNLARSEAVKRGVNVSIVGNDTSDSSNEFGPGWNIFVDMNGDGALDTGETVVRIGDPLPAGVTLDNINNVAFVTYQPTGILSASPNTRTFNLCDNRTGETGRQIVISPIGRISTSTFDCD